MKPAVKSAFTTPKPPRKPKAPSKIPVTQTARQILAHVKYTGPFYTVMLHGKKHHWADEPRAFILAQCDKSLFSQIPRGVISDDEGDIPQLGVILALTILEKTITSSAKKPFQESFLFRSDIEQAQFHSVNADAASLCLIDQVPEALIAPILGDEPARVNPDVTDPPF